MLGPLINVAGIILGGLAAFVIKKPISARHQSVLKIAVAVATVWFGLKLTWNSLNGGFLPILKQLAIVLIAMAIGKLIGKLLRLQKLSNSIGQYATREISAATGRKSFDQSFMIA